MIDINISNTNGNTLITNPLELFFQELYLAISIAPTQIWGTNTALDTTKYLFNQYMNNGNIKSEIQTYISENCSQARTFPFSVDIELMKIDNKELLYVAINISDTENDKTFLQKFLLGT